MTPTWICTARAHKSDIVKFAERGEAEAHLMQAHRIHESVVGLLSKALERNTDIPNNCRFCLEPVSTHPGSADDLRSDYLQHTAAHFAELADTYVPMMREFEALTQHLLAEHPLSLLERQTPTLPRSDSDRLRQWIHTFVDPLIRPLETGQDEEDDQPPRKSRMLSTGTDITLTREPEALAHGTAESSGQLPSRRPHYTLAAQINE
ncbi:hypothetical protein BR93DRAFT_941334 [Coniochaeta sp. PMI_546]|nr:hypothetical protein BR93DRAFT_941334 [Coniochaeta sp. PMI_546]